MVQRNLFKRLLPFAASCFIFYGCTDPALYHDPSLKMTEEDFKKAFSPITEKKQVAFKEVVPEKNQRSVFDKRISLSVTPVIPLRSVFQELAAQSGISLALPEKGLEKGVALRAKNQTVKDVVRHLCRLGGMRYELDGETLFVTSNLPYLKTYDIQFLVGSRKTVNNMSVSTDMNCHDSLASAKSATHSNTVISSVSEVDFWKEIETTVQKILLLSAQIVPEKKEGGSIKNTVKTNYAIHRQAGLLSVKCLQKQHQLIEKYLLRLRDIIHSQVLIEAKIVEVLLKEEYNTGIDWDLLSEKLGLSFMGNYALMPSSMRHGQKTNGSLLKFARNNMNVALNMMELFGTVRTIANPRLTALNNQSALLKVADNEVFFSMHSEHTFTSQNKPHFENIYSKIQTVPIGLVLTVQPSINPTTQEVTLSIKPSISRVSEMREDPAVSLKNIENVKSYVPVVQVREMDSMVTLKPGDIVVMGGLIEKVAANDSTGMPGVRKSFANHLLGGRNSRSRLSELVIFLTVKVNHSRPETNQDNFLYKTL